MPKRLELVGRQFTRWTVLSFAEVRNGQAYWLCRCVCGTQRVVGGNLLRQGKSKSCGCWNAEILAKYPLSARKRNPRRDAQVQKQARYFSRACKKHPELGGERYTSSAKCVACQNAKGLAHAKRLNARTRRNAQRQQRLREDAQYRLSQILRSRLYQALKGRVKIGPTKALTGCELPFLTEHLERQFSPGMCWENHGTAWEVDHKLPVASFDLTQRRDQERCFHYSNLQPLWKEENRQKGASMNYQSGASDLPQRPIFEPPTLGANAVLLNGLLGFGA